MIKDESLRNVLERVRGERRPFKLVDGTTIELGRLTVNDCVALEKALNINLFETLMSLAREGAAAALSYELQRNIFWHALKKAMPEITIEEAGDLLSAMPMAEVARALAWILTGQETTPTA